MAYSPCRFGGMFHTLVVAAMNSSREMVDCPFRGLSNLCLEKTNTYSCRSLNVGLPADIHEPQAHDPLAPLLFTQMISPPHKKTDAARHIGNVSV